jgi:hypothetical protein
MNGRNILIGSMAMRYHFPDFKRTPKDTDWIGVGRNIPGEVEFHRNPILENYHDEVLSANDLYTLKMSHIFWDIRWEKHMFDIQFMIKKGCVLNRSLFDKLYAYWNEVHGENKRSDLAMTAKDFFNNALPKTYDHDFLHTLINPVPTYTKVLKDGAEVEVDEDKFNALSFEDKLALVREEVYVMAYERLAGRDYRIAYSWMLKKFILHHAPIWEAIFIVENFIELHLPKINYKEKLDYELSRIETSNLRTRI